MVIDATRPYEWRDKSPKVNAAHFRSHTQSARDVRGYLLK
jgi:hypothetical protein